MFPQSASVGGALSLAAEQLASEPPSIPLQIQLVVPPLDGKEGLEGLGVPEEQNVPEGQLVVS